MKNKIWKVLLSFVLVLQIVGGVSASNYALAEEETKTADVTLHKRVYEESPEIKENTGEEDPYFGGEPLSGAEFTAYDVTDRYHELISASSLSTTEDKQKEAINIIQEEYTPNPPANSIQVGTSQVTDEEGIAGFQGLDLKSGKLDKVYVFVETKTPWQTSVVEKSVPIVLAMPVYKANGTQNFDIHLYPKNITSEDEKLFDNKNDIQKGATASINGQEYYNVTTGDILDFELQLNIPADIEKREYVFLDNPSDYFAYEKDSLKIEGLTTEDYTIVHTDRGFEVTLHTEQPNVQALAGKKMIVTYQMKLTAEVIPDNLENNEANVRIDGENRPEFTTKLKPDPENPTEPEEPGVLFGTGGKKFVKEDAHTAEKLAGAEFVVKNTQGEFAKFLNATNTKGEYVFEKWVATEDEATRVISDAKGAIAMIGFTNGSYTLKEVKTPTDKYVLLKDEVTFLVEHGTYGDVEKIVTVGNTPKGLLPSTGGSGIYLFLIVGSVIMIGTYLWFKKSVGKSAA